MAQGYLIFKYTNPYLGCRLGFKRDYNRNRAYKIHDDFPDYSQCKRHLFKLVCELYEIPIHYSYIGLVLNWLRRKHILFHYEKCFFGFEYDSVWYRSMSYSEFRDMYNDPLSFE